VETRNDWLTRTLPTVALVAFLVVAFATEFTFAIDVLKLPSIIAAGVPIAIDCYVVAAFRAGRDVRLAMGVTGASLAAATGWHMATAPGTDDCRRGSPWAGLVLMLLVVVLWRVHVISHPPPIRSDPATAVEVRTETVTVTATRSVAYLPATYVRTVDPAGDRIRAADPRHDPIDRPGPALDRSPDPIDRPVPDPIRSDAPPRSGSPTPIGSGSGSADWTARSAIRSDDTTADRSDAAVLADFRLALAADPVPSVDSIRTHYRIAPKRARAMRDAIKTDRGQPATGGVEGDIGS
jgi:hypothetical protein